MLSGKVFQVWEGGRRFLGRRQDTVRYEISIPSFSNSPWMRGAPQSGLAAAIFLINARISGLASNRPLRFVRKMQVQNRRKPFRY